MKKANYPEDWRAIPLFAWYEVSNHGRVRSYNSNARPRVTTPKILKIQSLPSGHQYVCLYAETVPSKVLIHRMVLEAFVGPAPSPDHNGLHDDGDPSNNFVHNLYWGTQAVNCADTVRHGRSTRGERSVTAKVTEAQVLEIRRRVATGEKQRHLAMEFGITTGTMGDIVKRRTWGHI